MKPSPGKTLILWLAMLGTLFGAEDYRYTLELSTQRLYEKAPLVVTFEVEQTDHSTVMFFNFTVNEEGRFRVYKLGKTVEQSYHHDKERYTYLVFPLEAGEQELHFDLLVMRTNEDVVKTSYTGGRYNVKKVETEDTHETLPPRRIEVLPLPQEAVAVGRFKMTQSVDRTQTAAHSPVYLTRRFSGIGFVPDLDRLGKIDPIDGVTIFSDKPVITENNTPSGVQTDVVFRYALMATAPFGVPSVTLQGFDPLAAKSYGITVPGITVDVTAAAPETLLDKTDAPAPRVSPLERLYDGGRCLLVFAVGFASALLLRRVGGFRRKQRPDGEWRRAVKRSSDARALLHLLIAKDPHRYADPIGRLEAALRSGETIDLKAVKKAVLSLD